jgi:hypothetical protein
MNNVRIAAPRHSSVFDARAALRLDRLLDKLQRARVPARSSRSKLERLLRLDGAEPRQENVELGNERGTSEGLELCTGKVECCNLESG